MEQLEFDRTAAATAWGRLVGEYAAARPDADLTSHWVGLVATVTGADAESVEEQVRGCVPHPSRTQPTDAVVVEVMNGVSDVVVRLCADVVLYGDDDDPAALVAEARQINDRYCDLLDMVVERHPEVDFDQDGGDEAPAAEEAQPAPAAETPQVAEATSSPAPWLHRTGAPVNSDALGGLVKRLVSSYASQADAVTLEAMWRSAFGAASGCSADVIQEVCEAARLPEQELSEHRAANEIAAGFEELFAAAVVRLFAADSSGNGDLADEGRRLVQRRDALFDLMEELYPGMYEAEGDD